MTDPILSATACRTAVPPPDPGGEPGAGSAPESAGHDDLRVLMTAYQAGNLEAFDQLYGRLAPAVRKRLAALARDASWVDDLLQETFLQMHRARRSYNRAFPVQPWVLAIARHVFLMSLRSRRRRRYFDTAGPAELDGLSQGDHESSCLASDSIDRCLAILSPRTRQAVVLHHLVGLSFEETGTRLGMRASAVKLRVSRAVATIQKRFGGRHGRRPEAPARPAGVWLQQVRNAD